MLGILSILKLASVLINCLSLLFVSWLSFEACTMTLYRLIYIFLSVGLVMMSMLLSSLILVLGLFNSHDRYLIGFNKTQPPQALAQTLKL